jgi:hypothetical protein
LFEALAPLRLYLFNEPQNFYRGGSVHLEAVLADENALAPGEYPVRILAIGPGMTRGADKIVSVTAPAVERLPRNLPRYMGRDAEKALLESSAQIEALLNDLGYRQ